MFSFKQYLDAWKKDILVHKKDISISFLFVASSVFVYYLAGSYANTAESVSVPDLILDHLPQINLSILFVWGAIIIYGLYFAYPIFVKPEKIHYYFGMFSLFLLIRSGFFILTHLGPPTTLVSTQFPSYVQWLLSSNDFFFSGHVGMPFLGFLISKNKLLKKIMLISSFVMAITVLFMHQHYSIDVFAAFFISYGIYVIGNKIFSKGNTSKE